LARSIAVVHGTAITPGVSRNGRLYTAEHIRSAVGRAQPRITAGDLPLVQRTHHAAEDDSTAIVGRLTSMTVAEDGSARYTAELADTPAGHNILNLIDTSDNQPPFLRGVSIRGAWLGKVRQVMHEGRMAETGDDLDLDGLDYTQRPGVPGATVDRVERLGGVGSRETDTSRVLIFESVQEALVDMPEPAEVEEKGAPSLKSGKPAAAPTKAKSYADPGYQDDKAPRYALDTRSQARAAWSYINQAKNAKNYTAAQLKRIKGRIKAALTKFGVKVAAEGWLIDPVTAVTETAPVHEDYDDGRSSSGGSFRISMTNGPTTVSVSSYGVDPADLEIVGHAAMAGAVAAITGLDPDLDGDVDAPGDAESADDSMESVVSVSVGGSVHGNDLAEVVARGVQRLVRESPPGSSADPTISDLPAPGLAADHTPEEESDVSEPTTPAVEPQTPAAPTQPAEPATPAPAAPTTPPATPAEPAAPSGVHLSDAQFQALLDNLRQPVAAGVPAETAPTPPEPVAETQEQMIARLVGEGVKAALPAAVIEAVQTTGGPARKGLVRPVAETSAVDPETDLTDQGVPADWPQKPLHKYTDAERRQFVSPTLQQHVLGSRENLR
jgi:hypothetical protein